MGFASAFFSTNMSMQISGVPKPIGAFWLIAFILFIVTASQYYTDKNWFYLAFVAILLSQILIILAWKDAKFGTIINLLILLASLIGFGEFQFQKMVTTESELLLLETSEINSQKTKRQSVKDLPPIVQTWLRNSGALEKEPIKRVKLEQRGIMRTKPEGRWLPFEATQYYNIGDPSFVWHTNVQATSGLNLLGRDKLIEGKGNMLIKIAGLIPVVDENNNKKINTGAMIRFLGEICWFPFGALENYITWETIDATSARATLNYNSESVTGIFKFSKDGDFSSFEADRYYGGKETSKLEKWVVHAVAYNTFEDISLPSECDVIWKLSDGDFHWLNLEITNLDYNVTEL